MSDPTIRCSYAELVSIDSLKDHPLNRNQHSDEQIDRLAAIIAYQGVRHPIIISKRSGYICAGHGRAAALRKLGVKNVAVDYQDFTDDAAEYAFLVSDNAIASWAELDLSGINTDLPNFGPELNIDMLGIKGFVLEPAEMIPQCDEDEIPEHVEPRTKLGDVYLLGGYMECDCGERHDL